MGEFLEVLGFLDGIGIFFLGSLKESEIILGSQNFGVPLGKNLEDLKKTNPYFYFFSALLFFLFFFL